MKNNLFLLIGEDRKNIEFALFNILDKIDFNVNNKIIYDMNSDKFNDVLDEVSMISLFSSEKVIIVNNFVVDNLDDSEYNCLEKFIESKNKNVYLILICNKIDARKKNYKLFKEQFTINDVSKFDDNNIFDYVCEKISEKGYKIDSFNIEYLISKK